MFNQGDTRGKHWRMKGTPFIIAAEFEAIVAIGPSLA